MVGYLTMSDRSSSTAAAFFRFSIHILRIAYCYWFSIRMMIPRFVLSGGERRLAAYRSLDHLQHAQGSFIHTIHSKPGTSSSYLFRFLQLSMGGPSDDSTKTTIVIFILLFCVPRFHPGFSLPLRPLFSLANGEKIGDGARCGFGRMDGMDTCVRGAMF